jgi:hypothetical protein
MKQEKGHFGPFEAEQDGLLFGHVYAGVRVGIQA